MYQQPKKIDWNAGNHATNTSGGDPDGRGRIAVDLMAYTGREIAPARSDPAAGAAEFRLPAC